MIGSTGEIFSSENIKNYLESKNIHTSQDTLIKYNQYLIQSFFISKCKYFELKGKKEMKILGKYYLTDHGFHHALIEDNAMNVTHILENIVYVELLRREYKKMLEEILIKLKLTLYVKNQKNTNIFRFLTVWKVKGH